MSERIRNVAVGITVIVALLMLAGMIMIFTTLPAAFQGGYPVRMQAPTTFDVEPGLPVQFSGVRVGYIRDVRFTEAADPTRGVTITARIDRKIRLPGNTGAYIYTKGFVGSPWIDLEASGPARIDPKTGRPLEFLPTDGSVSLQVVHRGSGLIPDELKTSLEELRNGFKELGTLARNLNGMLFPAPSAATGPAPASTPASGGAPPPAAPDIRTVLAKLAQALEGLSATVGDPENQTNFKTSLASLAKVTAQAPELMETLKSTLGQVSGTLQKTDAAMQTVTTMAAKAGGNFDQLTAKLMDDMDKLAVLLTSLNQVAGKLQTTEGTAGKLLNDPKLYNNLLEITNQLQGLMKELRVLVETWEKSGVGIKLK